MSSDEAPLVVEETLEAPLVVEEAPRRSFNLRVFKVVCVTLLVCVLLTCLAASPVALFRQRQQIQDLQRSSEEMERFMQQSMKDAVKEQRVQMHRLPVMDFHLRDLFPTTEAPEPWSSEDQQRLESLQKDLDDFNQTSRMNLQDLKDRMRRSDWQGLESWLRNWLVFQKAQREEPEVTTTTWAPVLDSKCLREAQNAKSRLGSYRPRCDHRGRYRPVQCWHTIRICWCVDQTGATINGTTSIGRPRCNNPSYYGSGLRQ